MAEVTVVWKILCVILVLAALLELFRTVGAVTRPLAVLVLVMAALEAIFIFGFVGTPGTLGLTGWIAVISTAIFILGIELIRISGGFRTSTVALLLTVLAAFQFLLSIGLIHL